MSRIAGVHALPSGAHPVRPNTVLTRTLGYDAAVGTLGGALAGTALLGVLGAVVGALAGAVFGAVCGVASAAVLGVAAHRGARARTARILAAATWSGCAAAVELGFGRGHYPTGWPAVAFLAVAALLGLRLGPLAAFGAEPLAVGSRRRPWSGVAASTLSAGAVAGGSAGAVVGLVSGLVSDPRTSMVVMVRDAAVGAVLTLVLAAGAVALGIGPRLRARR